MRLSTVRVVAVLVAAMVCAAQTAMTQPTGDPIKLTYVWQPGMTTYYRMITDMEFKSVKEGTTEERISHDRTAMMLRVEVYSVRDDGTARVAATVTRTRRQSEGSPKGKEVYDSADTPEKAGPEAKIYGLFVGKTIIGEITPEGRVLHVQGFDEILQSMTKNLESEYPGSGKFMEAGAGKELKDMFGNLGSRMFPLDSPTSNVARRVGEQRKREQKEGASFFGMQTGGESTSTFESVDLVSGHRIARISTVGSGSMKSGPPAAGKTDNSLPMPAFDSTSTLRGLWLFDLDRGRTVRSEMHNSASVKSKGTKVGNDTMPGMDMQVKSSVLTELVGPEDSIDPQSEGMKGK